MKPLFLQMNINEYPFSWLIPFPLDPRFNVPRHDFKSFVLPLTCLSDHILDLHLANLD